ncbi:MAG: SEC-C metal-binding domain-containing protein [Rhodothermales bacterium]|nr:SEC-C metal-binding domain-containing protein [Rhodothermales bacterium]
MPYVHFYTYFPEIAEKETRNITVFDDPILGSDSFGLLELYCDEAGCDCRRVMLEIRSLNQHSPVAIIVYGWESVQFYKKWYGRDEKFIIDELKGPALNSMSNQTDLAPRLLELVSKEVLSDHAYIDRLKRHYKALRERVDPNIPGPVKINRPDRNAPCGCGSGRKYKYCCGA